MRYSKAALLIFGAGAVLGLAVVSAELRGLARVASLAMAAGIALLPLALVADWRRALVGASAAPRRKKPAGRKPRPSASRKRVPRKR